ncbi:MAG: hypothetical protein U9Q66_04370 [Patescibacteria group bacterium]|nr:hypothetical protein [Patescibacteria group bacterium]
MSADILEESKKVLELLETVDEVKLYEYLKEDSLYKYENNDNSIQAISDF